MKKLTIKILIFWLIFIPLLLIFWIKQPFVSKQDLGVMPQVDVQALQNDVVTLSTTYAQRNFWQPATLDLAAQYIQRGFANATERVRLQTYQVDGENYHNVIAEFGPQSGAPLIIGAHYDVYEETPGADDNASGVAGLLALARIFKENPPTIPIKLIAYTLEEPPNFRTDAMGSRQHAAQLVKDGVNPRLIVVLEMIGYFNDQENSQQYPLEPLGLLYPTTANFIGVVGNFVGYQETRLVKSALQSTTNLPVVSINAPSLLVGVDFSDHASYWQHDMPAVMVTDTSFYRNANYHKPTDTHETLDYARMATVVEGVYGVVKSLSLENTH